ncbi:hypothetical protein T492DRAFT_923825 [Pavlovales sp. CCMP2436]|nr:hypothetical protein T492DRAFT_923825 [Pavlovales sp. CCMP2436]
MSRVPDGVVHRRWTEREGDAADLSGRQQRVSRFRLDQRTAAAAAVGTQLRDPKKVCAVTAI